jgi:hypothetical protein
MPYRDAIAGQQFNTPDRKAMARRRDGAWKNRPGGRWRMLLD